MNLKNIEMWNFSIISNTHVDNRSQEKYSGSLYSNVQEIGTVDCLLISIISASYFS